MEKVIGIDLGTTNSAVAFKEKYVKIIPNSENDDLTRSCVTIRDNKFEVGRYAFNHLGFDPENVILNQRITLIQWLLSLFFSFILFTLSTIFRIDPKYFQK